MQRLHATFQRSIDESQEVQGFAACTSGRGTLSLLPRLWHSRATDTPIGHATTTILQAMQQRQSYSQCNKCLCGHSKTFLQAMQQRYTVLSTSTQHPPQTLKHANRRLIKDECKMTTTRIVFKRAKTACDRPSNLGSSRAYRSRRM